MTDEVYQAMVNELAAAKELADKRLARKNLYKERSERLLVEKGKILLELERVARERDAAVKDLSGIAEAVGTVEACEICAHNHTSERGCEISDDTCMDCDVDDCFCTICDFGDKWEWRGCVEDGGKDDVRH